MIPHAPIFLNSAVIKDFVWFAKTFNRFSGVHILRSIHWVPGEADLQFYCDASSFGLGFWSPSILQGFHMNVPLSHHRFPWVRFSGSRRCVSHPPSTSRQNYPAPPHAWRSSLIASTPSRSSTPCAQLPHTTRFCAIAVIFLSILPFLFVCSLPITSWQTPSLAPSFILLYVISPCLSFSLSYLPI
jgi:hypothetical protein